MVPASRTSSMASLATVVGLEVEGERDMEKEEGLLFMVEVAGLEQVEAAENKREGQQLGR